MVNNAEIIAFEYLVKKLKDGNIIYTTLKGGSMRPTLKQGQKLLITPVPIQHLKIGDIIGYRINKDLKYITVHRIVNIQHEGQILIKTKGDNNDYIDVYEVTSDMYLGLVTKLDNIYEVEGLL